ncbi:MAG: Gfo/Idh/MocA family oxidoreductase [Clostridia bacterium]|nr:Gfo/Idh/MocA family oxidoreductase [Clostridia bacterium]
MINIGLVGTWHVHFWGYANAVARNPNCRITVLWDPDGEAGRKAAEQLGCAFEPDYARLLGREDVDAVVVCSATNLHKELIIKAAEAKKHIFTEKVLCFTKADAEDVARAIRENGVGFTISFPWKARPDFKWIKQAVDGGLIGKISYCRMRNAHNGASVGWLPPTFYDRESCGGGAMMDLGAHSMYILEWLMGRPKSAASAFTNVTVDSVEDNAVTVFTYEDGAIGVSETAFVAERDPFSFEIVGDKGTILAGGFMDRLCYNTGSGWVFPDLPAPGPDPLGGWIDALVNGGVPPYGIDEAVGLSNSMEMAYGNVI